LVHRDVGEDAGGICDKYVDEQGQERCTRSKRSRKRGDAPVQTQFLLHEPRNACTPMMLRDEEERQD